MANGRLTQDEADATLAQATDRITAFVNGDLPRFDGDGDGPFGGPRPGGWAPDAPAPGSDTTGA